MHSDTQHLTALTTKEELMLVTVYTDMVASLAELIDMLEILIYENH